MNENDQSKLVTVDLMIEARWLATAVSDAPLLANTSVMVKESRILAILPTVQARLQYSAASIVCLDDHVLIPGLINLHTHAPMSLMRGIADDKPLMTWLNDYIWPAEQAVMSDQYVFDASLLSCAEMLSSGITCFNDMYFYPEATARAITQSGMRANLGLTVIDFPTAYANDADDYLRKGLEIRDQWHGSDLITFSLAPHAPYTVSNKSFESIVMYADQLDMTIHTHLHETVDEVNQSMTEFSVRPLERLFNLGVVGQHLTVAHAVHCTDSEIDLLAAQGVHIAHCPTSNLKLGSGIAPIAKMLASGINIGLGTDGVASNNRLDIFAEMRLTALLAKGATQDATIIPAEKALEMATINAAKALGLDESIGSIEVGKQADFAAVKLSDFDISPYYEPISHLVYACGREHVTHTWVSGQLRYNDKKYSHIDPVQLKQIISIWQPKLSQLKNDHTSNDK
jgi:5-methylthioadenosine/S-adenosylhomocysteine deaminase